MPTVNTALGPVETKDLGFTLSHEHAGTNAAGQRHTYPESIDRAGLLGQAAAAMRDLTIATNPGPGRPLPRGSANFRASE